MLKDAAGFACASGVSEVSKAFAEEQLDAAAAWHVRLQGNVSEEDWCAYTAWLEADPQNRDAFDAVLATSDAIDVQAVALTAQIPSTVVQFKPRARARFVGWVAGVVAVAAALAVFVLVRMPPVLDTPQVQTWSTAIGETKDLALADGSQLRLNTDTQIVVTLTKARRDVRLERGEASFDVAHDAARPFVVAVGDRHVQVVGTQFDILRDSGSVTVTVARGVVAVGATGDTAAPQRLSVGDQYTGREGDPVFRVAKVDPTKVMAWQAGRLIFEDAALTDVISSLNRYFGQKVVVDDSARDLRFSGILKIDDEPSILRRLESFLPVVAEPRGNELVLKRRTPA